MKKMTIKVMMAVLALSLGAFALMGCGKDSDSANLGGPPRLLAVG